MRQKAETEITGLKEELSRLNAASDDEAESFDMDAIQTALEEVIDFSGPTIDEISLKNLSAALRRLTTDITAGT